jgi:hypothetical protein
VDRLGPEATGTWAGSREKRCGLKGVGQNQGTIGWAAKNHFNFSNKDLNSKVKDSNTLKPNLKWSQTRINLNKLFEDFSNLELLKIDLNIEIQTKALNGGHLK